MAVLNFLTAWNSCWWIPV